MGRLVPLLAFLLTSSAWAQPLTDTGSAPFAPFDESADRPAELLLENFDKGGAIFEVSTVSDGTSTGFTFGTSPFGFQIGEAFGLPDDRLSAAILGADIHFGNVASAPVSSEYAVQVWSGTPTTGPVAQLYSESFPISGIQFNGANVLVTEVRFAAPVPVTADSFFVVIPFNQNVQEDSLALGSTGQAFPTQINETWHFFNGAWTRSNNLLSRGGDPLQTFVWVDALADVVSVAAEPLPGAVASVRAFPNPVVRAGTVELVLAEAADVRVSLLDVLGREVAEVFRGRLSQGLRALDLDVSGLRPSTYLVRVDVGGGVVTRPVSVLR